MRILTLRFKNLNSLTGEWYIDFTHPAYQDTGIFAITGATGAGKSTILDALCLALYGQTPRLGKISKSSNEIMSRQYGECFAEIEFTTTKGTYRCRWGQHRSRKKAKGDLQSPQHEIVDTKDDRVIAHKIKDVLQTVEDVSGMNFDRFTRSMLLAQGGFAAFLQAKPDERAPLLEQITGTKIYSDISKKVHERKTTEANTLAKLEHALAGIHLLSNEDKTAKKTELQQQKAASKTLHDTKKNQEQTIEWHKTLSKLESQLNTLTQQQESYQQRYTAAQPQRRQLKHAIAAEQLADDYQQLKITRQQTEQDKQEQIENKTQRVQLDTHYQKQQQCLIQTQQAYEAHKTAEQKFQQTLIEVRELDTRIAFLTEQHKKIVQKHQNTCNKQQQLQLEQQQLTQAKKNHQDDQQRSQKYLQQHPEDETLIEHLASITLQLEQLQTQREQTQQSQQSLTHTEKKHALHQQTLATAQQQATQSEAHVTQQQQTYATLQTKLAQHLENQSLSLWQKQYITNEKAQLTWQTLATAISQALQLQTEIKQLQTTQQSSQQQLDTLLQQQAQQQTTVQTQTRLIDQLNEKQSLQRTLKSLTEHRNALINNEPCPLCGALEHPYHTGDLPAHDVTQQQLSKEKALLKQYQQQQQTNLKEHSQTEEKIKQITQRLNEKQAKLTTVTASIKHEQLPKQSQEQLTFCQQQQQQLSKENKVLAEKTQQAEALENKLQQQKTDNDHAKETLQQHQRALQENQHQQHVLQSEITRLHTEHQQQTTTENALTQQLQNTLQHYGVSLNDDLTVIKNSLKERQHRWKTANEKQQSLEKQQHALYRQDAQLTTQHTSLQEQHDELATNLSDSQHQLDTLQQQRHHCFADKDPAQEAAQMKQIGENIQREYQILHTAAAKLEQQQQTKQKQQQRLKETLILHEQQQTKAHTHFQQKLSQTLFDDEAHYLLACIEKQQRQQLQQEENARNEEKIRLDTLHKDLNQRYQQEQQRNITQQPLETLEEDLQQLNKALIIIERDIGAINEQLNADKTLSQTHAAQQMLIDVQKKEGRRWNTLHQLIGSADGKKFRNFAQGLTFEIMIVHANQQLQKMHDRYLLIHNGKAPLELNIIDNYQAGEERSIKNLSGGESFIVSLALALGLSQMASNQISIDSLFLDEGFGTLDEETLETALEALAKLHQDNKLIGVISHVASLKERIPTQIHIEPDNKGHSRLSGPGIIEK
jgi:exonuclease SbcC